MNYFIYIYFTHYFCCLIAGELGDFDPKIMVDCSYVSEFRFIPDQVWIAFSYFKAFPAYSGCVFLKYIYLQFVFPRLQIDNSQYLQYMLEIASPKIS